MDVKQCRTMLHNLQFTAAMNQRYHQMLEWRWGFADRGVRIIIGVIAAFGVVSSASGAGWESCALCVSVASLFAAIVLNVVPFGEITRFYADLFRRWSDLRQEVEAMHIQISGHPAGESLSSDLQERFQLLRGRKSAIIASEPSPWKHLLVKCYEDVTEALFGQGIRTHQQAQAERQRRYGSGGGGNGGSGNEGCSGEERVPSRPGSGPGGGGAGDGGSGVGG